MLFALTEEMEEEEADEKEERDEEDEDDDEEGRCAVRVESIDVAGG